MNKFLTLYTPSPVMKFRTIVLSVGFLLLMLALPVLAETVGGEDEINWFTLTMGLFGGLAMFLFGMEQMSEGLKAAAGDTLKNVLSSLTRNRFMGALTGAFVTAILNSSSVTTVLVVGFISAGFMTLAQSVGVIMGANVGSTFTAQIVAFNITQYALLLVAVGFFMLFAGKRENVRHSGAMVMGLSYIEHTLAGLFAAAGRKELENSGVEMLAREAMALALIKQKDFDIVKEATRKRDAKFAVRRSVGLENAENPIIEENEEESAVYE